MIKYRPEIDGLRAVAVLPVLLFHAGNSLFAGGYLGVDVFFTISGYLITSIIISEQHKNVFSLIKFYSRRAKRILPPLFVVLAFVAGVACFFPGSDVALGSTRSLSHIVLFTANIYFYNQGGYFDTATELQPLFHTWSLSLEEQFYVIFPLFLIAAKKISRRTLMLVIVALTIGSLSAAHILVHRQPSWAYYMLPTRAWELLAGAMVAIFLFQNENFKVSPVFADLLSFGGLILIVTAMCTFDSRTPHPSFYTVIPVLGSVLIISSAQFAVHARRALGSKIMVGIGLISYSLYLWHQPLLAYYKVYVQSPIPLPHQLLIFSSALTLSIVTWKLVEQPTRRTTLNDKKILLYAISASLVFFVIGRIGKHTQGFDFLLSEQTRALFAFKSYDRIPLYREGHCFLKPDQSEAAFSKTCAPAQKDGAILWGDSHAAALYHGLNTVYPGIGQFTAINCPPVLNIDVPGRSHCTAINNFSLNAIAKAQPKTLFLSANWIVYFELFGDDALMKSLEKLSSLMHPPKIILIGGFPQWQPSLVDVMHANQRVLTEVVYTHSRDLQKIKDADARLKSIAKKFKNIQVISPASMACRNSQCLSTVTVNNVTELMAWDYAHLTKSGSEWWAKEIEKQIEE